MKKLFTKEVIIGLVTIVSLFILYSGVNYLKGINIFQPTNHYYVLMPNVAELQNSSPVYIDGFKVGQVNAIEYEFNNPNPENIIVQISLDKQMKLQTGSYIELKTGLTSGAYLNIMLNKYVSSYLEVGDTISGITETGLMDKLSTDLLPQIENILPRLDSILYGIQVLVNHPALTHSLNHIETTTGNLQKSTNRLNNILSNDVPAIVENLNKVSSDFTVISGNMKDLDLKGTLSSVDKVLQNVDQMTMQLNNPNGSLGKILNDSSLYNNLNTLVKNGSALVEDIKGNPKKYVHVSVF